MSTIKTISVISQKKIYIPSGTLLFSYESFGGGLTNHTTSEPLSKTILEWYIYIATVCFWHNTGLYMYDEELTKFVTGGSALPVALTIRNEEIARAIGFIGIDEIFSSSKTINAVDGVIICPYHGTYKFVPQNTFYSGYNNKSPSFLGYGKTKISTNVKTISTNLGTFNDFDEDFILYTYDIEVRWFPEYYIKSVLRFFNTHCKNGASELFIVYNLFFLSHTRKFEIMLDGFEPVDDIEVKRLLKFNFKLKEVL